LRKGETGLSPFGKGGVGGGFIITKITPHSIPQIRGFANIKNFPFLIVKFIHAGGFGEKFDFIF